MGLKVGRGTNIPFPPNQKGVGGGGGAHAPLLPASYASDIGVCVRSVYGIIELRRVNCIAGCRPIGKKESYN